MPFQFAIGVTDFKSELELTRESFVLVDANGKEHALSEYGEVDQGLITGVRNVDDGAPLDTGNNFFEAERVLSNFCPQGRASGTNHLTVRRHNYVSDVIYFPRLASGLDGVLTLRITAEGLVDPVELRFRLAPPVKKKKQKKRN